MSWDPARRASTLAARRQGSRYATAMGVLWGVQALVLFSLYAATVAAAKYGTEETTPEVFAPPVPPAHVIRLSPSEVRVDGHPALSMEELLAVEGTFVPALADALPRAQDFQQEVLIEADKQVQFSAVKKTMSTAAACGYDQLSFATFKP